jgi:hypothetical protein
MTRVTGTKKQRAAEVLQRASNGSALDMTFSAACLPDEQKLEIGAELSGDTGSHHRRRFC